MVEAPGEYFCIVPAYSARRYLEAVTPVLAKLHPSTIVDSLHFKCTDAVQAQNKLKHEEVERPAPPCSSVPAGASSSRWKQPAARSKEPAAVAEQVEEAKQESKTSRLQLMLTLNKVFGFSD